MYDSKSKKIGENSLDYCSICGVCKPSCPVFKIELSEASSPRGKVIMLKSGDNSLLMYKCTLCGACTVSCPAGVDLVKNFRLARSELAANKIELSENSEMIKNLKKFGNPYGKPDKTYKPKY